MIAVRKLRGTHLGLPLTLTQPRWDLAFFERTCGNIQVEVTLPKGWGGELMADGISLGALGETRWNHDAIDWLFLELVAYDMRIGTCRFCYNYRSLYVPGPVSHLQQLCKLMAWPSWLDFGKEANSGTKSYFIFLKNLLGVIGMISIPIFGQLFLILHHPVKTYTQFSCWSTSPFAAWPPPFRGHREFQPLGSYLQSLRVKGQSLPYLRGWRLDHRCFGCRFFVSFYIWKMLVR